MMLEISHVMDVVIQASTDDSDGAGKLGLLLLTAGFVFYGAMYLRYRNTDKRHHYETETKAEMRHLQQADVFARSMKRLRNSRMKGANNTSVRGARRSLF